MEGGRSFYYGMSSPLAGSTFSEALQFTVLRKIKLLMLEYSGQDELTNKYLLLSAVITGILNSFILTPIELIKI